MKNQLFGIGLFARRHVSISEKFSLNFSLYTIRESGNEGQIERYFPYFSCPNCLSIANPVGKPFKELNWKFGFDLAFAYQISERLKLELRANLVELRLQKITDPNPNYTNILANPYEGSYQSFYGNFTDFGSADRSDGIRFGLVFAPF